MKTSLFLAVAALALNVALSQVISTGRCPKVTPQKDFDLPKYLGKWYEVEAFPFFFTGQGTCITAEYSLQADGTVKVNNTKFEDNVYQTDIGVATYPDPFARPGELCVKFAPEMPCGDYRVLDTDYETYTFIHACSEFGFVNAQTNWILSRGKSLDETTLRRLKQNAAKSGIKVDNFRPTIQNCNN